MAELLPYRAGYYLWKYVPSLPAAIIFALLFLVITALHVWRLWRTRLWFCIPFAVGGLMQFVGYIARAKCHSATDGYSMTHEWTLYVFDSLPMFVVMVVFYVWYPAGIAETSGGNGDKDGYGERINSEEDIQGVEMGMTSRGRTAYGA